MRKMTLAGSNSKSGYRNSKQITIHQIQNSKQSLGFGALEFKICLVFRISNL